MGHTSPLTRRIIPNHQQQQQQQQLVLPINNASGESDNDNNDYINRSNVPLSPATSSLGMEEDIDTLYDQALTHVENDITMSSAFGKYRTSSPSAFIHSCLHRVQLKAQQLRNSSRFHAPPSVSSKNNKSMWCSKRLNIFIVCLLIMTKVFIFQLQTFGTHAISHSSGININSNSNMSQEHQVVKRRLTDEDVANDAALNTTTFDDVKYYSTMPMWMKKKRLEGVIFKKPKTAPRKYSNKFNKNGHDLQQQEQQQMVILAGPHSTGLSNVQQKLWNWISYNNTQNYTESILQDWVWPVPLPVIEAEYVEHEDVADWTPSDIYYPLIDAIKNFIIRKKIRSGSLKDVVFPKSPSRLLFQKYTLPKIFGLFKDVFEEYWGMGYNVIVGSEAWNHIVSYPMHGVEMIQVFQELIIPTSVKGDQITVVVFYHSSKLEHLLTQWSKTTDDSFETFIEYSNEGTYSILDSLGMVDLFLMHTDWNIALIDMKGVDEDGWDMPNFIACHIMNTKNCDNHGLMGFDNPSGEEMIQEEYDPTLLKEKTNIAPVKLQEIEDKLQISFDCFFQGKIKRELQKENKRLSIYRGSGITKTFERCSSFKKKAYLANDAMKKAINDIIKR
jgi:hypothetical protein